jgi:peptidoglycan/xylan/chitin deacetylase (PgdA/CDA1 family)
MSHHAIADRASPGPARAVPVLMYHRVCASATPAMRRFTVAPEAFDAQLQWLRERGYTGLTVSDFVQRARWAPQAMPARPIVLTFDDGFADFLLEAAPILSARGFPATLYVVAGRVGGHSAWLGGADAQLPLLDWPQLAHLSERGIEIGAHGMTHLALDGLTAAQLQVEVEQPRATIAQHLGRAPSSFCYPFGFRNAAVRRQVRAAGYTSACAVRYGTSSTADDPFDITRHIVTGNMPLAEFAAMAAGHPPLLPLAWNRLRSNAAFLARNALATFQRRT